MQIRDPFLFASNAEINFPLNFLGTRAVTIFIGLFFSFLSRCAELEWRGRTIQHKHPSIVVGKIIGGSAPTNYTTDITYVLDSTYLPQSCI